MGKSDDAPIIAELKQQSDHGYRLLFVKYHQRFLQIAINLYGVNPEDAKELVNDALLKAGQAIDSFESRGEKYFQYWLQTILKNTILDYVSRKKKSPRILNYDESDSERTDDFGDLEDGSRQVAQDLTREFLYGANIKCDDRVNFIALTMKEFELEEQEDLWSYFLEIPHAEIAKYRKKNSAIASRKYINRLVHNFFDILSEKTGLDRRLIYEGWKKRNRKTSTGGVIAGEVTDP
ncbi:MAG: sigma factor [Bacteroidota bacterium]